MRVGFVVLGGRGFGILVLLRGQIRVWGSSWRVQGQRLDGCQIQLEVVVLFLVGGCRFLGFGNQAIPPEPTKNKSANCSGLVTGGRW